MDTLTHICLGACLGEGLAGKKIGKRALLLGAVAQSLPDIDFIAATWSGPANNLLAHRGFTHSLLFIAIIAPLMGFVSHQWHKKHKVGLSGWIWFWVIQMLVHIFLDAFNSYGTGWFEPFSHYRISFNTLFVADPLFSIWTGLAFIALVVARARNKWRRKWINAALLLTMGYLGFSIFNKFQIDRSVKNILNDRNVRYSSYLSTPAPFNNFLWYVAAGTDSGYYIGYRSLLDRAKTMEFKYYPKNLQFIEGRSNTEDFQHLVRFSKGFYVLQKRNDTLIFNDIRFGQIAGWQHPNPKFAFYFYLQQLESNTLVVQRGRFEGWDRNTFYSLVRRIKGN